MTIWEELETIPALINGLNPRSLKIHNIRANKLSTSSEDRKSWLKHLTEVIRLVDDLSINYVLIKYLDLPYVYMQDIDLLIEKRRDRQILFSALRKRGFTPYRSLFPPNPEKVEYVKLRFNFQIDIYPETAWWKLSYAPTGLITSNRILKEISGIKVYLPSPTYDLYMFITHSYVHRTITLAELAQVTKLILNNKVEWKNIAILANQYMFEHVVYIYLLLVNRVLKILGQRPQGIHNLLDELGRTVLSRKLSTIIKSANTKDEYFPLKIPISFWFLSALREVSVSSILRKKPSIREFLTYWLLVISAGRTLPLKQ